MHAFRHTEVGPTTKKHPHEHDFPVLKRVIPRTSRDTKQRLSVRTYVDMCGVQRLFCGADAGEPRTGDDVVSPTRVRKKGSALDQTLGPICS